MNRLGSLLALVAAVATCIVAPMPLQSAQEEPKFQQSKLEWQPVKRVSSRRFQKDAPLPPGTEQQSSSLDVPKAEPLLQKEDAKPAVSSIDAFDHEAAMQFDDLPIGNVDSSGDTNLIELIATAHENSPSLRKLQARVDEARGFQLQATLRPNPRVGYQAQEVGNDGSFGQQGIFWSQRWVRGGKLQLSSEVWNWEAQRRGWEYQVERFRIANQVRQRYYNLLAARRVRQISELMVDIADRNLSVVNELFEAGEVARNDVLQAKIEQQQSELKRDNADISLTQSEQLLGLAVFMPEMDCSPLKGDILADVPDLTVEEIRTWLDEQSPELEVARAEIERARWKVEREAAEPISDVTTQAGLLYDDASNHAFGNFQVSWQIPKNNGNQGNIQAAQADLRRAQHAQTEMLINMSTRVQAAFQQYQLSQNRVRTYETRVLTTAKENLAVTREAYRIGEAGYQTLLTAQRSYFDASLALIEARRLLWLSVARIQSLVIPE